MDDAERRLLASTFDLDAEGYDDGRPDYPDQAWDLVLAHAELGPGKVAAMGDLLRRRFAGRGFSVQVVGFEEAEIGPASADAVCAATSFHWVEPEAGVARLRDILKPGAPLCLWWNVYRDPAARTVDPVDALVRTSTELPNTRGLNGILDELDLPRRLAVQGFVDIEAHTVRWTGVHTARDQVLAELRLLARQRGDRVERPYTTPILLARAPR